jgi:hypothetical protein
MASAEGTHRKVQNHGFGGLKWMAHYGRIFFPDLGNENRELRIGKVEALSGKVNWRIVYFQIRFILNYPSCLINIHNSNVNSAIFCTFAIN